MRSSIIRSTAIVASIRLVRDLQASLDSLCAMALHALSPRHLQAGLQSNERNPNACRQWLFLQPVAVTVPAPAAFKAAGAAATRPAVTGRRKRGTGTGWFTYPMAVAMSSVSSPVVRLGRGS
jgi:hypothetical protein